MLVGWSCGFGGQRCEQPMHGANKITVTSRSSILDEDRSASRSCSTSSAQPGGIIGSKSIAPRGKTMTPKRSFDILIAPNEPAGGGDCGHAPPKRTASPTIPIVCIADVAVFNVAGALG